MVTINCLIFGETIKFQMSDQNSITEMFVEIYNKFINNTKIDIYDFEKAVKIYRTDLEPIVLSENKIATIAKSNGTLNIVIIKKSWTMGKNYDPKSMSAICPITLKKCIDPIIANCCNYVFEKLELLKFKNCPMCRVKL